MSRVATIPSEGTVLGDQFVLGREIGRGAVGAVFEAKQLGLGRKVAVKMLLPDAMAVDGILERFEREAQLASSLTSAHTIRIFAFDVFGEGPNTIGLPYIVMELLDGETLQGLLERRGRLAQAEAIGLLLQVLDSLTEAHQKGVIHRDVKPENLFLARSSMGTLVKVLDFGIAKAVQGGLGTLSRRLTATGMILGTPLYMAPEQVTGEAIVTPALDVYGIGCIAYHMLSGAPPFEGGNGLAVGLMHLSDPVPRLESRFATERLANVVQRSMAKDPNERYANAGELRQALVACQNSDEPEELHGSARIPTADFPAVSRPPSVPIDDLNTMQWRVDAIRDLAERIDGEKAGYEVATVREMPRLQRSSDDVWPSPDDPLDTYLEMPTFQRPEQGDPVSVDEDWVASALELSSSSEDDEPSTFDSAAHSQRESIRAVARRITPIGTAAQPRAPAPAKATTPLSSQHGDTPTTEPSISALTSRRTTVLVIVLALLCFIVVLAALVAALVWWR